MPVGFKWFAPGLFDGSLGFGGEESAGASFLRRDGTVWTTDKDGLILGLLAAEITARTGKDPGEHYQEIEQQFGKSLLHAHRRAGDAGGEEDAVEPLARSRESDDARRRADQSQVHAKRPATTRSIGGLKVDDQERLVRGAAFGHGRRLQDLRGESAQAKSTSKRSWMTREMSSRAALKS